MDTMDNLHYKISVKLVNPNHKEDFHTLEFLIPRDNITNDVTNGVLIPEIETADIEICGSYVIKRIDK